MQKEEVENNKSYNQIIKAFGLFGGVQIFNILINMVRSKFIAVLLGISGLGLYGLFISTLGMIGSLTNLGLNSSAILSISKASAVNDQTLISRSIINLRRWVSFTGALGAIITLILASKLSQWVFGNDEYKLAFIWLSVTLFFQSLSSGQSALLQGMRKLKQLAKVSVIGSSFGLFISLSLFYFFGLRGIVPSIILTAASTLFVSWYFASKVKVENLKISMYQSLYDGLDMVKLGLSIAFTNFFGISVLYLVQVFINKTGGTEQLGLYVASFAIINGYFGMIFSAMSTDLFPRIAAISIDNLKIKTLINQQSIIMILILAPLLIFLISSLPFFINLLFSPKFLPIIELLKWAILGVVFQAIGYPTGLTIAAKGHSKIYLILVIALHLTTLLTYVVFYHFLKLEGIGIAFLLVQSFFFIIGIRILQVKYSFSYEHHFIRIFLIQFVLITATFLVVMFVEISIANFSCIILVAASALYSYFELKKRIDFRSLIKR
jgi:O-antigen/teichoic acid export membrane protein